MFPRFALWIALASMTLLAPRPAHAATLTVYSTVDAIEVSASPSVTVTGVLVGATTPTTTTYTFHSSDTALVNDCARFGAAVMAKPGKFHLGIATNGGPSLRVCKLIRVTP